MLENSEEITGTERGKSARTGRVVIFLFLVILALAWSKRFIMDDAYISACYARNFAEGHGLVYIPGEDPVEGYSNFLWTLWMAVSFKLGLKIERFLYLSGMFLLLATLGVFYSFARLLLKEDGLVIVSIVLLGGNASFVAFSTGGLETMLVTFIFTAALYLCALLIAEEEQAKAKNRVRLLSATMIAAALARPDGLLLLPAVSAALALRLYRYGGRVAAWFAGLLAPLLIVLAVYAAWKYNYYGDLLPNTFYAKVSSFNNVERGLRYLYAFFYSYFLFPVPFLVVYMLWREGRTAIRPLVPALVLIVTVFSYVTAIGGDFMEYRFLVPVLPAFFLVFTWALGRVTVHSIFLASVSLFCLYFSGNHYSFFDAPVKPDFLQNIRQLHFSLPGGGKTFVVVGKALGKYFRGSDVVLATSAAGAIPYFSRLKTIDMLGLNDRWIARNGPVSGNKPGHQRRVPLWYLCARKVNLLVGHPFVFYGKAPLPASVTKAQVDYMAWCVDRIRDTALPEGSLGLIVPLGNGRKLVCLYIRKNKTIDEAVSRKWIRTIPIEPAAFENGDSGSP